MAPERLPAEAVRWHFNACVLDESAMELRIGGERVELERKPLEVLRHFLRHPGEVLSKDDLLKAAWPGRVLSDTVLAKAISRIREVCGDTDERPLIKTVHRYGYRLEALVTVERGEGKVVASPIIGVFYTGVEVNPAVQEAAPSASLPSRSPVQQPGKPSFLAELQRRHVYKVGAAYAVGGWLLAQVVTQVLPIFDVSMLGQRILVLALIAGFPIALVLAWLFDVTPAGIVRTQALPSAGEQPGDALTRRGADRRLNYVLGGLLVLALGYMAAEHSWLRADASKGTKANAEGATLDKSVAVLPFENLSADPNNAFFAAGIQDEILTRLSKIGALKVISRTSTRQYATKPDNLKEIAQQLGVSAILEGSVQKAGDTVKVTVQLIRASTDEHLWAESYSKKLDDVFAVEGEVAQNVAEALKATLSGEEVRTLAAKPTDNPAAYEAYLRGRTFDALSFQNFPVANQALSAYLEAARLDPHFALAWARAAVIGSYLYFNGKRDQATPELVRHAAEEASRLQPDLPEAVLARGAYKYRVLRDYRGGWEDFKAAQQKFPNDAGPLLLLMFVERRLGYWEAAVQHAEAALALDPRNFELLFGLAYELYPHLRRLETARALANRAAALQPDSKPLLRARASIEIDDGRLEAAAPYIQLLEQRGELLLPIKYYIYRRQWDHLKTLVREKLPADDEPNPEGFSLIDMLGVVQHLLGDEAGARNSFSRRLTALDQKDASTMAERSVDLELRAVALSRLGRHEEALAAIAKAKALFPDDVLYAAVFEKALWWIRYRAGEREAAIAALPHLLEIPGGMFVSELRFDPELDPIRDDPRVQALIQNPPPTRLDAKP